MITKLRMEKLFEDPVDKVFKNNSVNFFISETDSLTKKKRFNKEEKLRIVSEGREAVVEIEELCQREGISFETFRKWEQELFGANGIGTSSIDGRLDWSDEHKFQLVIEGRSGATSVAEICRREGIAHGEYLGWLENYLIRHERKNLLLKLNNSFYQKNKEIIQSLASDSVLRYCEYYLKLDTECSLVVPMAHNRKLEERNEISNFVSLQKLNDVRYINKYLEKVNASMKMDGVFIGCLETFTARKQRMRVNSIPVINNMYFGMEFLIKRILPKVSFTKRFYFNVTKGNDRLLSKAEGLGRLVSCGFRIMDYKTIDGLLYFVVKKEREPYFDFNPSYGPVYKMPRLGKNGKMIGVYKFRTMHPYSEYLQDYIVKAHGYAETGKPADDFRIPKWGKFMRRFWLDELPQLFNVLKGELKLVGIRPVSQRYFQDIPKEMQKLRLTQIPGCIPPYVALNRDGNVMSVLQAEKEYLVEKIQNPYTTDIKYFFSAVINIVFKHKRSA